MEKGVEDRKVEVLKIVLTGPECTAKSTLASGLAGHYRTIHVPEYARDYVQSLDRPYVYDDVNHIARMQLHQFREPVSQARTIETGSQARTLVFFDTYLEITRVWFDVVFKDHPAWIDDELARRDVSLFLLCDVDIPWVPDGVRENGGEMREKLFSIYRDLLEQFELPYRIVSGSGKERLMSAVRAVDELLSRLST